LASQNTTSNRDIHYQTIIICRQQHCSSDIPSTRFNPLSSDAMPPRKRAKKGSIGVNGMAKLLSKIQHDYHRLKPMPGTVTGNINTAAKHLKTTFTGSTKGTKKSKSRSSNGADSTSQLNTPGRGVSVTPPANHDAAPELNARSSSRIARYSRNSASPLVRAATEVATRLDTAHVNLSSTNHGTKKLTIREILSMRRTDQFTLVIPPVNSKVVTVAREARGDVIRAFDSIVRACLPPGLDADGILSFMNRERAERTIS
jgi:hypothetical protein